MPRRRKISEDYFKIEALKVIVGIVVLVVMASILTSYFGTSIDVIWNVVVLFALADLVTIGLAWFIYEH